MKISNLKEVPHFANTVADRGWHAWWTESGVSLEQYRSPLDAMIEGDGIPLCLVAHEEDIYLGSVLVIDDDLEARPDYAPWIAALWVEAQARHKGIASRLLEAARAEAVRLGTDACYLCATADKTDFYRARGFELIETDVSGLNVSRI